MRKVYQCEHTVPPVWWFTFADRNALGEEIVVEFRKNENTHGREISLQKTEIPRLRPVGMTGFAVTKHWQAGWRKSGVS